MTADASEHDAYYLKYKNPIYSDSCQANADSVFAVARSRFVHPDRMMRQLFTKAYASQVKDPQQLMIDLFEYHGISQSSYGQPDLSFLFTEDELYELWQLNNFEWYYEQGPSPLSGGHMPWLACNLLRNIVETADTALCSARPSASLRFGHDTNLAPLVSLMQIETFDKATAAWDSIPEYYQTYRIIPMCGNIQLVFYRKAGSSDVLVKPLLNEREVRLANVATDQWPYYHWADVRRVDADSGAYQAAFKAQGDEDRLTRLRPKRGLLKGEMADDQVSILRRGDKDCRNYGRRSCLRLDMR